MLQSTLAPRQKLLLEIYETIEEPDGIYAIARSHQAKMQAALFEHEGMFPETSRNKARRACQHLAMPIKLTASWLPAFRRQEAGAAP
jgi:hypothetical protein